MPTEQESLALKQEENANLAALTEEIRKIFDKARTPEEAKAITDLIVASSNRHKRMSGASVKPEGWSPKTQAPYYKEQFARPLLKVIDGMLEDTTRTPMMFWYKDYPHYSKNTLRNRIYQAFNFAVDHLDPDKKYMQARLEIEIVTDTRGVKLQFLDNQEAMEQGEMIVHKWDAKDEADRVWKHRMDKFIEEAEVNTRFSQDGLDLTDAEMQEIEVSIHGLKNIRAIIKKEKVTLIKVDPDNLPEFLKPKTSV